MAVIELGGGSGTPPVGSTPSVILPESGPSPPQLVETEVTICEGQPIALPAQVPPDGIVELESIKLPGYGVHIDYLIDLLDVAKIRGDNDVLIYQASTGLYNHGDVHSIIDFPVDSVFGRTEDVIAVYGDYAASLVSYIPTFPRIATNVQTAIDEVSLLYAKNFLELDDTPSSYAGQAGRYLVANALEDALEFAFVATVNYDPVSDTYYLPPTVDGQTQNLGQEVFVNCVDQSLSGETALNPKVFMVIGTNTTYANFLNVTKPRAQDIPKGVPFGLNTVDIDGITGKFKLITYGFVNDVDTSAWTVGDLLWVDPVTPGEMTNVESAENPYAIGIVAVEDSTQGSIFVSTIYPIGVATQNLAGIVHQNAWFTGDAAAGAPTFYAVKREDTGVVASIAPQVIVDDNLTLPLPDDWLGVVYPISQIFYKGTYNGRVEASVDDSSANELFTLELYIADATGTPIDSGIAAEPVGSLGVRPLLTLDSGIRNMSAALNYEIDMSGVLREEITVAANNRVRGRFLCTKVGSEGPAKTFTIYAGNLHNTFIRVPPFRTLTSLVDVDISSPTANQFLTFNGGWWINTDLGSIDKHSDVDVTTASPVLNEVLKWDGANWIPGVGTTLYNNATPMPEEVGGYEVGTTFVDQDNDDMWDGLLYPYQYPAFSSFVMSGQTTTLECGVDVTGGVRTFTWGTTNPSNINANSIVIRDLTDAVDLGTGLANDGTEDLDIGVAKNRTVHAQNWQWRIQGTNDQSGTFTRTTTVTWYSPTYYGVSSPAATVATIQGMTKLIQVKANRTYAFSPTVQVYYYAFPASFGVLTSILDANGFETIGDWTLRVENFTNNSPDYEGVTVSYNIYEFNNVTTQVAFNNTFIF